MSGGWRAAADRRRALAALGSAGALALAPAPWVRAAARVDWTDIALVDGRVLRAAELSAQYVVVELWATWCPFCKKQNPHLQKLHETAGGKGLLVLTFALDDDLDKVREYLRHYRYTFATARLSAHVQRWFGKRRSLPELYVVDKAGQVVVREEGEMFPEDVAALARFAGRA